MWGFLYIYSNLLLRKQGVENTMPLLASTENPFGGVIVDPKGLVENPLVFQNDLCQSVASWRTQSYRVVWLEIPIELSKLIPVAVEQGFVFHHSCNDYLMLTCCLEQDAFVPAYASHYIGAGGVTLNSRQELLVVSEKHHRSDGSPPRYKLPGGALFEGEHLAEGVVREVQEETGIQTEFDALVCFRHWHNYRYGKSDIYFVCRLHPITEEISIQEEEIAESLWMPVNEYLEAENVHVFNKRIVCAAMTSPGITPSKIQGYDDSDKYEFFMPGDSALPPL